MPISDFLEILLGRTDNPLVRYRGLGKSPRRQGMVAAIFLVMNVVLIIALLAFPKFAGDALPYLPVLAASFIPLLSFLLLSPTGWDRRTFEEMELTQLERGEVAAGVAVFPIRLAFACFLPWLTVPFILSFPGTGGLTIFSILWASIWFFLMGIAIILQRWWLTPYAMTGLILLYIAQYAFYAGLCLLAFLSFSGRMAFVATFLFPALFPVAALYLLHETLKHADDRFFWPVDPEAYRRTNWLGNEYTHRHEKPARALVLKKWWKRYGFRLWGYALVATVIFAFLAVGTALISPHLSYNDALTLYSEGNEIFLSQATSHSIVDRYMERAKGTAMLRVVFNPGSVAAAAILIPLLMTLFYSKGKDRTLPLINGAVLPTFRRLPVLIPLIYFGASVVFAVANTPAAERQHLMAFVIAFGLALILVMLTLLLSITPAGHRKLISFVWVLIALRFLTVDLFYGRDSITVRYLYIPIATGPGNFHIVFWEFLFLASLCGIFGLQFFGQRLQRLEMRHLPRFAVAGEGADE